jgi:hypothetical protein
MLMRPGLRVTSDTALALPLVARAQLLRALRATFATSIPPPSTAAIMSVLLETSLGDITIDLLVDDAPKCCEK